jgi:uncharacterized membrane protein YhiD involved in acid resistance
VIGNNLARAFGLVGSLSIIRFRTAVKDTKDIVYLFFSLATGMMAGAGYFMIAMAGTLLIGAVLAMLAMTDYGMPNQHEFLVQFIYTGPDGGEAGYIRTMAEFSREYRITNAKSKMNGASIELSYYVRLKDRQTIQPFIRALCQVNGVEQVKCFFDEG